MGMLGFGGRVGFLLDIARGFGPQFFRGVAGDIEGVALCFALLCFGVGNEICKNEADLYTHVQYTESVLTHLHSHLTETCR